MAITVPRFPEPKMSSTSYRAQAEDRSGSYGTIYASPTDSEFSEAYSDADDIRYARSYIFATGLKVKLTRRRRWDERRVGEWLRSINAGQYVDNFRGI